MRAILVLFLCLHSIYGLNDTFRPKAESTGGAKAADLMVQRASKARMSVSQLFYRDSEKNLYAGDQLADTLLVWNLGGKQTTEYVKPISGEFFSTIIPVKNIERTALLGSDNQFRVVKFDANYAVINVSAPVIQIPDPGYVICHAHADKNGVLYVVVKYKLTCIKSRKRSLLYRIKNKVLEKVMDFEDGVDDFVFSIDYKKMFAICAWGQSVCSYDYDLAGGKFTNKAVVFNATQCDIRRAMSSIETDKDNQLWVAAGQSIFTLGKNFTINRVTELPVAEITSITFGGYDDQMLFAGSTRDCDSDNLQAGSLFVIDGIKLKAGVGDELMVW